MVISLVAAESDNRSGVTLETGPQCAQKWEQNLCLHPMTSNRKWGYAENFMPIAKKTEKNHVSLCATTEACLAAIIAHHAHRYDENFHGSKSFGYALACQNDVTELLAKRCVTLLHILQLTGSSAWGGACCEASRFLASLLFYMFERNKFFG